MQCLTTRLRNRTTSSLLSSRCRRTVGVAPVPPARSMSSATAVDEPRAVFVYGSLMHPDVVKAIIGRVPRCSPAAVFGYARRRVLEAAYPACIRVAQDSPGAADPVRGLLYHDCSERERRLFDLFEEVDKEPPMYARVDVDAWPVGSESQQVGGAAAVSAQLYEWVRSEGCLSTGAEADWSFEAFCQPAVLGPYLVMCREFVDEATAQL